MGMTQRYRDGYLSDEPMAQFEKLKSSRHKNSPEEIRKYQIRKERRKSERWKSTPEFSPKPRAGISPDPTNPLP